MWAPEVAAAKFDETKSGNPLNVQHGLGVLLDGGLRLQADGHQGLADLMGIDPDSIHPPHPHAVVLHRRPDFEPGHGNIVSDFVLVPVGEDRRTDDRRQQRKQQHHRHQDEYSQADLLCLGDHRTTSPEDVNLSSID